MMYAPFWFESAYWPFRMFVTYRAYWALKRTNSTKEWQRAGWRMSEIHKDDRQHKHIYCPLRNNMNWTDFTLCKSNKIAAVAFCLYRATTFRIRYIYICTISTRFIRSAVSNCVKSNWQIPQCESETWDRERERETNWSVRWERSAS